MGGLDSKSSMGYFLIPKDETELRHLLQHTLRSENRDFDFKSILPKEASKGSGHEALKTEFKVSFCAFAHSRGGYLIVGVNEIKDKHGYVVGHEVLGSKELHDVNAYISQIIDDSINNPIENWSVDSVLVESKGTAVHFIYIPASPSYKKPHMFDEKIFYRLNGRTVCVNADGPQVRRILEADFFSPCGVEAFKDFISSFRQFAGQLPPQYERYFLNLGRYLKTSLNDDPKFKEIYAAFVNVDQVYHRKLAPLSPSSSEATPSVNRESFSSLHEMLDAALEQFADLLLPILEGVE